MIDQSDPAVCYLIIRSSLNMSVGKSCAQVGHAVGMLMLKYFEAKSRFHDLLKNMEPTLGLTAHGLIAQTEKFKLLQIEHADLSEKLATFNEWLNGSYGKIVLKADDKEWIKLKELPNHVLVIDNGLTEIPAGSETCIGLPPMRKSQAPKTIKRLQLLK